MADGCVFCAIARGSTPASIVCDNVLRVYPNPPTNPERSTLDSYTAILRSHLD